MMKKIVFAIPFITAFSTQMMAQENSVFPKGEISAADNHTGTVWLKELNAPDSIFNCSIAVATFLPGAKLDWHIHPAGQILLIMQGSGYYQEKGKPIQIVHKGEIIKCLPGVEHWHGASPESDFTYLATTPAQKGKTIWLKRVTNAEYNSLQPLGMGVTDKAQEITELSKKMWLWMSDKNVDSLNVLFNEKSVFVHMGGSWGKEKEIDIIKSGSIHYKQADIQETSVQFIANTAILLSKIRLTAVVGGNEVVNSFIVTAVYIQQNSNWTLGSLSFTKLLKE